MKFYNNKQQQTPVPETPAKGQPDKGPPRNVREPDRQTTTQHLPTYMLMHMRRLRATGIRVRLLKRTGAPVARTYVFTRARALARVALTEHITSS